MKNIYFFRNFPYANDFGDFFKIFYLSLPAKNSTYNHISNIYYDKN